MITPLMVFWGLVFVLIAWVDWKKRIIPNAIVFPTAFIAVVILFIDTFGKYNWYYGYYPPPSILSALVGLVIGGAFAVAYCVVLKAGWGDGKLLMLIGLALGYPKGLMAIIIGGILGFIGAMVFVVVKRKLKAKMPTGAFLAIGALIVVLLGDTILMALRR